MKIKWIITAGLVASYGMAQAAIIYSGNNQDVVFSGSFMSQTINIAGDTGSTWDDLGISFMAMDMGNGDYIDVNSSGIGALRAYSGDYLQNLSEGTTISSTLTYDIDDRVLFGYTYNAADDEETTSGNFYTTGTTTGYIGLQFNNGEDTYYGWAQVTAANCNNRSSASLTVHDWAYNNVDGELITAGAVPEPATALSLMLGGLVVAGYRRIRKRYGL